MGQEHDASKTDARWDIGADQNPCRRTAGARYKTLVPRRKAVVVTAVLGGAISIEEVCRRYELSVEEFHGWQGAMETHGVPGLRVTRLQIYREAPPHSSGGRATERPCGARVDNR
jgi:hypothetical protein